MTVNQLLFFNGLAATSPVHASIIMTINPVLVLLISAALLGTAITARKVLGIALGAAGAITLLLNSGGGGLASHASWQGDLMVLLNAASYGVYLVIVKPLMSKYRPITVISWVFLFGGLMSFPVGASCAAIEWGTADRGFSEWGLSCCSRLFLCISSTSTLWEGHTWSASTSTSSLVFGVISGWPRRWAGRTTWRIWGGCRRAAPQSLQGSGL